MNRSELVLMLYSQGQRITTRTIKHWEDMGLLPAPAKPGHCNYSQEDVDRLVAFMKQNGPWLCPCCGHKKSPKHRNRERDGDKWQAPPKSR